MKSDQSPANPFLCPHSLANLCLAISILLVLAVQATAAEPAHRLIVGWDDSVIVCGPGTVAGMDSPLAVEQMVKRWKARGIQGVYWRVDEAMLPERFMQRWKTTISPGMNYLLHRVDHTHSHSSRCRKRCWRRRSGKGWRCGLGTRRSTATERRRPGRASRPRGSTRTSSPSITPMSCQDNPEAQAAYEEARKRIEACRRKRSRSLDLKNLGLTTLPPEIGQLTTLT